LLLFRIKHGSRTAFRDGRERHRRKGYGYKKYENFHLEEIINLYQSVGWTNMFLIIFPKCDILEVTNGMKCRVSDPDDARAIPEPDRYSALPVQISDAGYGVPDSIES
jgi:hypothetical protein